MRRYRIRFKSIQALFDACKCCINSQRPSFKYFSLLIIMLSSIQEHEQKKKKLIGEFKKILATKSSVRLEKQSDSNLYRNRKGNAKRLNVKAFNKVISVDPKKRVAVVEGMTTFGDFVTETLKYGMMPTVVPELKPITIGGAVSGTGLESSSFKYGFVHETILSMDILTSEGKVITCTKINKYKDLFYTIPNSYGTLGYILKLEVMLVPVKKYVKITRIKHSNIKDFLKGSSKLVEESRKTGKYDFLDGIAFGPNEIYLTLGKFTDEAPYVSDYKGMKVYYKSLPKKKEDYLTTEDYIWRWDTDWFWGSKAFGLQNPLLRYLWPKSKLNTATFMKMRAIAHKFKLLKLSNKLKGKIQEPIIQDAEIPVENAEKFFKFYTEEIKLYPMVIGPVKSFSKKDNFPLFPMTPKKIWMNFGCYMYRDTDKPYGYYNRRWEIVSKNLKGHKMLYSEIFYPEKEFWQIYNGKAYWKIKNKYDPKGVFKDLYNKCLGRN